jgi:CRP-like cAMP-binding protein
MTRQGAEAHWLYLLVKGHAAVYFDLPGGGRRQLAELKDGDYFGEMALLTGERCSATVVALSDCECWRLDREGFKDVIERRPEMAQELAQLLTSRKLAQEIAKQGQDSVTRAEVERNLLKDISSFFGLSSA